MSAFIPAFGQKKPSRTSNKNTSRFAWSGQDNDLSTVESLDELSKA
jgi:hypothetical protein